jgi:hypothetical protein
MISWFNTLCNGDRIYDELKKRSNDLNSIDNILRQISKTYPGNIESLIQYIFESDIVSVKGISSQHNHDLINLIGNYAKSDIELAISRQEM